MLVMLMYISQILCILMINVLTLGIYGVLIMIPFGILITALFRKSQPTYLPTTYLNEWYYVPARDISSPDEYATDVESQSSVSTCRSDIITLKSSVTGIRSSVVTSYDSFSAESPSPSRHSFQSAASSSLRLHKSATTFSSALGSDTDVVKMPRFPTWMVFITWALVLALCVFFTTFVVLYSIRFTTVQMVYCIESMLISAILGILVIETVSVFLYGGFYVYVRGKVDELYISKVDALADRCVLGK